MQSTGQGGRQSSQPVHSAAMTVCMRLRAPTIASTGQASRQRAQPMQAASSIQATTRGASRPQAGSSGSAGRPSSAASAADHGDAAGRAAIDLGSPRGDRLGVGAAAGEPAAPALGLRQQRIDARGAVLNGVASAGIAPAHLTFMPAAAPASGPIRNSPASPDAASTMPSETPKRSLRGFRFATTTTWRPTSCSGS